MSRSTTASYLIAAAATVAAVTVSLWDNDPQVRDLSDSVDAAITSLDQTREQMDHVRALTTDLKNRKRGDLDGDGDIDDADLATLLAGYTGPNGSGPVEPPPVEPPPVPTPTPPDSGFYDIDTTGAYLLSPGDDGAALQQAINDHGKVGLPAGRTFNVSLAVTRPDLLLFTYGEGPRATIKAPAGQGAITNKATRINKIHLRGVRFATTTRQQDVHVLEFRLGSGGDKYINKILIEDCLFEGGANHIHVVDDEPRVASNRTPPGPPGRIKDLEVFRCISNNPYVPGTDHEINLYVEGVAKWVARECFFYRPGWQPGREQDRTKKAHNIYAQEYNTTDATVLNCFFVEPAANAAQFRVGFKLFANNAVSRAALGPWFAYKGASGSYAGIDFTDGLVYNNAFVDQVDINPTPNTEWRGKGFMVGVYGMAVIDNIAARRHGTLKQEAFADGSKVFYKGNRVVAWSMTNYTEGAGSFRDLDTPDDPDNHTIDADPGVPILDEGWITDNLTRERDRWDPARHDAASFVKACRSALQ